LILGFKVFKKGYFKMSYHFETNKEIEICKRFGCLLSRYTDGLGDKKRWIVVCKSVEHKLNFTYNVFCYETDCLIFKEWTEGQLEFGKMLFGY
jgi:hypothetical protein